MTIRNTDAAGSVEAHRAAAGVCSLPLGGGGELLSLTEDEMTPLSGETAPDPERDEKLTEPPRKRVWLVGKVGPAFAPVAVVAQ